MKTSSHGITLIKNFEGLRTFAYKPVATEKYYTIGYGHYGSDVKSGDRMTEAQADLLLKSDLLRFEGELDRMCQRDAVELNQNQFDALISFSYNLGTAALSSSTLWACLRRKDYDGASAQFLRWNRAGGVVLKGLTLRREAERVLFCQQ